MRTQTPTAAAMPSMPPLGFAFLAKSSRPPTQRRQIWHCHVLGCPMSRQIVFTSLVVSLVGSCIRLLVGGLIGLRRVAARITGSNPARGLNSPAGPVLASAWSGLRGAVHASPRPAGSPAFLAPAWSGPGRPAGRENEGDFMIL
jgi:hypothetical protein